MQHSMSECRKSGRSETFVCFKCVHFSRRQTKMKTKTRHCAVCTRTTKRIEYNKNNNRRQVRQWDSFPLLRMKIHVDRPQTIIQLTQYTISFITVRRVRHFSLYQRNHTKFSKSIYLTRCIRKKKLNKCLN